MAAAMVIDIRIVMLAETAASACDTPATAYKAAMIRAFRERVTFQIHASRVSLEIESRVDKGPEVGHVGHDDGSGGFAGVPVEVNKGAKRGVKVSNADEYGAENLVSFSRLGHCFFESLMIEGE